MNFLVSFKPIIRVLARWQLAREYLVSISATYSTLVGGLKRCTRIILWTVMSLCSTQSLSNRVGIKANKQESVHLSSLTQQSALQSHKSSLDKNQSDILRTLKKWCHFIQLMFQLFLIPNMFLNSHRKSSKTWRMMKRNTSWRFLTCLAKQTSMKKWDQS